MQSEAQKMGRAGKRRTGEMRRSARTNRKIYSK